MSVSLYYSAHRDTPLRDAERTDLERIVDEGGGALIAYARLMLPEWVRDGEVTDPAMEPGLLFEPLTPYSVGEKPGELFSGASKITRSCVGEEPMSAQLDHYLAALARLRDRFPDAEWHVHVDDMTLPWVNGGYDLWAAG